METYLRAWRQDAVNKHQYDTAIFVADKLLALTGDDQDAFWLAQAHFSNANYNRAQSFLHRGDLVDRNAQCRYLAAYCSIKLGKFDDALALLGDNNPTHLISAPGSARQKLRHVDVHSRGGQRQPKRNERLPTSEERDREDSNNLKSEAGMCYLRGLCHGKQNSFDRAKECYKTACQIDVQCFEAFDALMTNSLLSPDEEWKFLESLNFDTVSVGNNASLSQEAAQFTKTLYTTRLSKYSRPDEFTSATETLSTHYNLSENADILLAKADLMFTHCRFKEALKLTTSVLQIDQYNFAVLPLHLASLHELRQTNALFLLSHKLTESHPNEPCSWLAVGIYYLLTNRIAEARRFFSKASVMDPHFGPAWIGFAHTFAAEGEHDQAISAYSTAARLFQGTHLPQLFLGMQNLQLNNLGLARDYFNSACGLCPSDPLLLNELGIVCYNEDQLPEAIEMFRRALHLSTSNESESETWIPTRTNLAHALRRAGQLEESLETFDEVLRQGVKDPAVFSAKGLVLMEMGRSWHAVVAMHEALTVSPQDPMATDLLTRALEANESEPGLLGGHNGMNLEYGTWNPAVAIPRNGRISDAEVADMDRRLGRKLKEIQNNRVAGRGGRRGGRAAGGRGGGEMEDMSAFGESMMVDSDE